MLKKKKTMKQKYFYNLGNTDSYILVLGLLGHIKVIIECKLCVYK